MNVAQFFSKYGFSADIDADAVLAEFDRQMNAGLGAGASGSLAMIPAYIEVEKPVPTDTPIVVLDAGGTNLRVAVLQFDAAGNTSMTDFTKFPMPGTSGEALSAEAFFAKFAEFLAPVCERAESVGFCFSYPTEISRNLDGKLLRWTKQVNAPEVVGQMIGTGISAALEKRTGRKLAIRILNDTVATLLAGNVAGISRKYSSYIGFILGTGTNIAYIESNARIGKVEGLDPAHAMVINVESGNFNGAPVSKFDELFDATTADPGVGVFEKMISGAYVGGLGLTVIQCAARDGMFSADAAKALLDIKNLSTKDFDDFVANPFLTGTAFDAVPFTDDDRRMMMAVGEPLFVRAATLTAINISAAVIRSGKGKDPLHPVCVTIDGSTYYRTRTAFFKSRTEQALREILGARDIYFETISVNDAPMIGSAVAGLIA